MTKINFTRNTKKVDIPTRLRFKNTLTKLNTGKKVELRGSEWVELLRNYPEYWTMCEFEKLNKLEWECLSRLRYPRKHIPNFKEFRKKYLALLNI